MHMHGNAKAYTLLILICLSLTLASMPIIPNVPDTPKVYAQGLYYTPITIAERSGKNLTNYAVKIVLNSTNFNGWDSIAYTDGSDIYFTDQNGNPLYYWIESFSKDNRQAVIWVKVPSIPANSITTIYMYYGGANPYRPYNNPNNVFLIYDHLTDITGWFYVYHNLEGDGYMSLALDSGTYLKITIADYGGSLGANGYAGKNYNIPISSGFELSIMLKYSVTPVSGYSDMGVGVIITDANGNTYRASWGATSYIYYRYPSANYGVDKPNSFSLSANTWTLLRFYPLDTLASAGYNITPTTLNMIFVGMKVDPRVGTIITWIDYIIVRPYVKPEPSVSIGKRYITRTVLLPANTMIVVHNIIYSPNSTQFSHSLTATNTSVAGYVTGYGDKWGWMLYAKPYTSNGNAYRNSAQLVSAVSISVPYSYITIRNVTLYAMATNTGLSRYVGISILDSSGTAIASANISSIPSQWSLLTLNVNRNITNSFTVKIVLNATSTETSGENISVKDIKIFCEYRTYLRPTALITPSPILNATAQISITVAPINLVNMSMITIYLVSPMNLTSTDYGTATYIGNTTMNGYTYKVYTIPNALVNKTATIYATLVNALYGRFRIHTHGHESKSFLVGEKVTIELYEPGNITLPELGKSYTNVTGITLTFNSTGLYIIEANITKAGQWRIGFYTTIISVSYGSFSIAIVGADGRAVDYESVVAVLKDSANRTVTQLSGKKLLSFANLVADNYTVTLMLRDVVVATTRYRLNISTTGKTTNIISALTLLKNDYRKLNKSVVWELDKQVSVENIDAKHPYSRMTIYINGSGDFKLYVNYFGRLPTSVAVSGNVSRLRWWWDGTYLVITGRLGSVGAINITDLYRLRIEAYDRTGNPMPSWFYIYVNGTAFSGSVADALYYPATYVVTLPSEINGFKFYGFFDGYKNTTRYVNISTSDVILKLWYRVPTKIVVRGVQVTSLLHQLFQTQDQYADVYIEGYVYDYYGNGVPNRVVNISLTAEHGFTMVLTARTDASGYFRTQTLKLTRGTTYTVTVSLPDDDTYIASSGTVSFKPEELPTTPVTAPLPSPTALIVATAMIALTAMSIAIARTIRGRRLVSKKH